MEPEQQFLLSIIGKYIQIHPLTIGVIISFIILVILLLSSALISGSEVAFFSLGPDDKNKLKHTDSKAGRRILVLLTKPQRLLATILISNNFVNIGIVILSSYVSSQVLDFQQNKLVGDLFNLVAITFLLLLFGEILPKIYATYNKIRFTHFMVIPIYVMFQIFYPISTFLIRSTSFFNKRFAPEKQNLSINDLSDVLDIADTELSEDKKILEGIVKFGNIDVCEIMKPRVDVVAIEIKTELSSLISLIIESGYSRIPVYSETFDTIDGVLYIKDLLPHLNKDDKFHWQTLARPAYFVPETKKINDLLQEFQQKKMHMAIVVDEYGGVSGIVTMEDIFEEIIGDISDESDTEEEVIYKKIDENNYIFEGKTSLNDFYKILKIENTYFDNERGDADTLAGLILEKKREIPQKGERFRLKDLSFTIDDVDKRRIRKIKVILPQNKKHFK